MCTGHSVAESLAFGKHKDWPTHSIYLHTQLAQMAPVVQTLQSPLHLMAGPGQCLSMASLAAVVQTSHSEMYARGAVQFASLQARSIGQDATLSAQLTNCMEIMLNSAGASPAMVVPSIASKMQGCLASVRELRSQMHGLVADATHAEMNCMAAYERLGSSSRLLCIPSTGSGGGSMGIGASAVGSAAGASSSSAEANPAQHAQTSFLPPVFGGASPSAGPSSFGFAAYKPPPLGTGIEDVTGGGLGSGGAGPSLFPCTDFVICNMQCGGHGPWPSNPRHLGHC
jgi:hypothetical protein